MDWKFMRPSLFVRQPEKSQFSNRIKTTRVSREKGGN
jgi:hypothetical protein